MALSSGPQDSSQSHIFQNSPTIPDMRKNRKYRKTLRNYQGALEDGMMVMLEDLEGFPAPVLCSFCENPVITRTKNERSGFQWYGVRDCVITIRLFLAQRVIYSIMIYVFIGGYY